MIIGREKEQARERERDRERKKRGNRRTERPASGQDHHGGGTKRCRQVFAGQLFTVRDRDGDRFHQ